MREATFTEVRNRARHFFDLVQAGEIVRVLRNGRPIAEIRPIPRDLPSWKRHLARPLTISGGSIGSMVLEDRGD